MSWNARSDDEEGVFRSQSGEVPTQRSFRVRRDYRPIFWITPLKGVAEKRYSLPVGIFSSGGGGLRFRLRSWQVNAGAERRSDLTLR
jgi:hypothetical protein